MGASYTNITLKGSSQAEIVNALRRIGHAAWVSPNHHSITAVYPQRRYFQGDEDLVAPARRLSEVLHCAALAIEVHDSNIFCYQLFKAGEEVDSYSSNPCFGHEGGCPPAGGDAFKLCAAFDEQIEAEFAAQFASPDLLSLFPDWQTYPPVLFSSNAKVQEVESILRRHDPDFPNGSNPGGDAEDYVFEEDRHRDLAHALELPAYVICAGYELFEAGRLPKGLERKEVMRE